MEQHMAAHISAWLLRGLGAFFLFLFLLRAPGWSAAILLCGRQAWGGILAEPRRGQKKTSTFRQVLSPTFGSAHRQCGGDLGVPSCPPLPMCVFSSHGAGSVHPGRVLEVIKAFEIPIPTEWMC